MISEKMVFQISSLSSTSYVEIKQLKDEISITVKKEI